MSPGFTFHSFLPVAPGFPEAEAKISLNLSMNELWVIIILQWRSFSFAIFFLSWLVSSKSVMLMHEVPAAPFLVKALRAASYSHWWRSNCWWAAFSTSMQLWIPDKLSCRTVSLCILWAVLTSRWLAQFCQWNRVVPNERQESDKDHASLLNNLPQVFLSFWVYQYKLSHYDQ